MVIRKRKNASDRPRVVLLGPQRREPRVRETLEELGCTGRTAAITAGWEEREEEIQELVDHLGRPVDHLQLWQRCEEVFAGDPELERALRGRTDRLRRLRALYRLRLRHGLDAVRALLARTPWTGMEDLLESEREAAIEAVRKLDQEHLERVDEVHAAFRDEITPHQRPSVRRHVDELRELLSGCDALCVAGGHVAVLLNRLRLFEISSLIGDTTVVAWSAGAMAVSDRVVLFHDSPPQGRGNAEVLEAGLGLAPDLVVLPHASKRLDLEDKDRTAMFARRFLPSRCLALDLGTRADRDGETWTFATGSRVLAPEGLLEEAVA